MSQEGWSPVGTQLDHCRTEPEPCPSTALLPAAAPPVPSLGAALRPRVLVPVHKPLQRAGQMLFVNVSPKGERNRDFNCSLKN